MSRYENKINRKSVYNNYIVTIDSFFVFIFVCTLSEYLKMVKSTLKKFVQKVIYYGMKGKKQMDIIVQRLNAAHSLNKGYKSPIAETFNGKGLLENFIRARLTNRQTIRLLLQQEQLQAEENAIAEEIAEKVVSIFK